MNKEENNSLVKVSAFVQKVGNQIAVTNKLVSKSNERLAKKFFEKGNDLQYEQVVKQVSFI